MIMCKIDDFIDVTSRYIAELLDLRADIRQVEKDVLHTLPANITAGYTSVSYTHLLMKQEILESYITYLFDFFQKSRCFKAGQADMLRKIRFAAEKQFTRNQLGILMFCQYQ